ncbi:hypothetical protein [Streptomyces sp. SID3343]|uniref:hypothetical protein n=1 Tax=Streptomyces sp. SID3343 TaxID=2690260 RepID=UPI00136AECFC|nr:hypothetical protein [Streptomyces sp. SID3343]MYV96815.1 hypothetical protein [Streptomyces sp. SID3343]
MEIGTKVKAKQGIGGGLTQSVPVGAAGVVAGRTYDGRIEVLFTLRGVLGGSRIVEVAVEPGHVEAV